MSANSTDMRSPDVNQINKGKKLLMAIFGVVITIYIIINIMSLKAGASSPQDIISFSLTIILFYLIYKGHNWAKWTLAILLLLAALFGGFVYMYIPKAGFATFSILLMSISFGISGVALLSPTLSAFMKSQRSSSINPQNSDNT